MTRYRQNHRFMVLIGGGIGELYDAKVDLTFKQAVKAWVHGQKKCPTDCQMVLEDNGIRESADSFDDYLEKMEQHERKEAEMINALVADNRRWVEQELLKQGVYNLSMLNSNPAFPNCHPFSRG
jgi:hypothetical protein